jgi:NTP pyrophosphatase (non-canonical NTP hydrolase)
MTGEEYKKLCKRTASGKVHAIDSDIIHGAAGCVTEAAELMDAVKKAMFYGKPLDHVNILEELGDLQWYIALIANKLGYSFEDDIWPKNIQKLKIRYPEKFESEQALFRDLDQERESLESTGK